jgi:hypothetical protein
LPFAAGSESLAVCPDTETPEFGFGGAQRLNAAVNAGAPNLLLQRRSGLPLRTKQEMMNCFWVAQRFTAAINIPPHRRL